MAVGRLGEMEIVPALQIETSQNLLGQHDAERVADGADFQLRHGDNPGDYGSYTPSARRDKGSIKRS